MHDIRNIYRLVLENHIGWLRIIWPTSYIGSIRNMTASQTGVDFQIYFCSMQCMRSVITEFSWLISPLEDLVENLSVPLAKRARMESGRVSLQPASWNRDNNNEL